MNKKAIDKIQNWVDNRFGIPNTFNTQLLIDFLEWAEYNVNSDKFEEAACEYCRESGWSEPK